MAEHEIVGTFCRGCRHRVEVGAQTCPQCAGVEFVSIPADEDASLVSWTVIRQPAAGFPSDEPIVVAVARFSAGNLAVGNLVPPLDGIDGLAPGRPVRASLADDGRLLFSLSAS